MRKVFIKSLKRCEGHSLSCYDSLGILHGNLSYAISVGSFGSETHKLRVRWSCNASMLQQLAVSRFVCVA